MADEQDEQSFMSRADASRLASRSADSDWLAETLGADGGLSAAEYLAAAFAIIEEQAERDPVFAARLAQAMGATVLFEGALAPRALDPLAYARRHGAEGLKRALNQMSFADLRAFVRAHQLVSQAEFRQARNPAALIDRAARTIAYRLSEREIDDRPPIG